MILNFKITTKYTMKTKVLYFPSNSKKHYYNIYTQLEAMFNGLTAITADDVDKFLQTFEERFYVKELPYQLEIYNVENEYVFCINKPMA
jgi:hypothetical protein